MNELSHQARSKAGENGSARKRAKAMSRSDRRKQLLEVAGSIAARGGAGVLTMTELAEAAGVSKPVVYEHFSNGEDVAIALLNEYFKAAVEAVDSAARDAGTLGEYLSLAVDAQFEFHKQGTFAPWVITNGFSSSERLNKAYRELREITLETFQDLLIQQSVDKPTASAAGFVLAAMMNHTVFEFAPKRDNLQAKETLKIMLKGAVDALAPLQEARPQTPAKTMAVYRSLRDDGD